MFLRPKASSHPLQTALLVVLAVLISLTAQGASFDDPESDRTRILEHRHQEAATKNGLVKGLMAAEAAKTPNQALYDVHHYDLDLDLNPLTHILTGTVTVTAEVTGASFAVMDLNLAAGMTVTATTAAGISVSSSRSGGVLTVNLDRTYTTGETVIVAVTYSGNPAGGAFGWSSHGGAGHDLDPERALRRPRLVALQGPQHRQGRLGGHPRDRARQPDRGQPTACSCRTWTTAPRAPSTGKRTTPSPPTWCPWPSTPTPPTATGTRPWPAATPWRCSSSSSPTTTGVVESNYALTVPMIGTFAEAFGEYPFVDEKYGHAEFTWGGGMEHQTITSMGGWSEDLISHELAHQWWGDMVTCADFGHIWLNEGFATWSEAYWEEQDYGFGTYQQYMDVAAYYGAGTIFVEDPLNDNIFDGNLSYNKGSWVVHMLRGVAGRRRTSSPAWPSTATNHALRQRHHRGAAGRHGGGQRPRPDAFFQQWIYGEYFPVYRYGWEPGPGADEITVTIDRSRPTRACSPCRSSCASTPHREHRFHGARTASWSRSTCCPWPARRKTCILDPDRWILRQVRDRGHQSDLRPGHPAGQRRGLGHLRRRDHQRLRRQRLLGRQPDHASGTASPTRPAAIPRTCRVRSATARCRPRSSAATRR